MKTQTYILALVVFLYFNACSSSKTTTESVQQTTQKIESKDFTIKVNYALPLRMKQVSLTSYYEMRIKNDSSITFLPYYGVAHVAPMNPAEGGIKFEEKINNYLVRPNKKNDGWEISFMVNTREYQYQIYLSIFNNGYSSITINSNKQDAITFYGDLE